MTSTSSELSEKLKSLFNTNRSVKDSRCEKDTSFSSDHFSKGLVDSCSRLDPHFLNYCPNLSFNIKAHGIKRGL